MSQVAVPPPPAAGEQQEAVAPAPARKRRRRSSRSTLVRDIVEVLLLAVALYVIITLALQTVRVDGVSMVPTLQDQDLLFADKVSYHLHSPERGDIVILLPPGQDKDFIKRIIGLPGDHLLIRPDYTANGQKPRAAVEVKPNGQGSWQVLDEPYINLAEGPWVTGASCCDGQGHSSTEPHEFTIPQDQYFVMGDNRNSSEDSRVIGLIPRDRIMGRAWLRIFPLGHFGFLGSGPTLHAAVALPLPLLRLGVRRRLRRRGAAGSQSW